MPAIVSIVLLALCTSAGDQEGLQEFNVSGLQCGLLSDNSGPWTVLKSPERFIDSCVQWRGEVGSMVDADIEGMKAWVIPVPGKFAYCGSTLFTLYFLGASGIDPLSSYLQVFPCDFLCTPSPPGIRRGNAVVVTGKVLGFLLRPDPGHPGRKAVRLLVGVTDIRRISFEEQMRSSKRLRFR